MSCSQCSCSDVRASQGWSGSYIESLCQAAAMVHGLQDPLPPSLRPGRAYKLAFSQAALRDLARSSVECNAVLSSVVKPGSQNISATGDTGVGSNLNAPAAPCSSVLDGYRAMLEGKGETQEVQACNLGRRGTVRVGMSHFGMIPQPVAARPKRELLTDAVYMRKRRSAEAALRSAPGKPVSQSPMRNAHPGGAAAHGKSAETAYATKDEESMMETTRNRGTVAGEPTA